MAELKPCPFCGGTKLKVERKSRLAGWNGLDMRVEMHTYSFRCNTCHARGGAVGGRVMNDPWTRCAQLPDWATTDKALEAKAIEAWNRRADNVSPVVRCKDCKHLVAVNVNGKGIPTCRVSGMEVATDEFCSRGEKGRR